MTQATRTRNREIKPDPPPPSDPIRAEAKETMAKAMVGGALDFVLETIRSHLPKGVSDDPRALIGAAEGEEFQDALRLLCATCIRHAPSGWSDLRNVVVDLAGALHEGNEDRTERLRMALMAECTLLRGRGII